MLWYNRIMLEFLKKYKISAIILAIVLVLLVLDVFSIPSLLGVQLHAEWVSAILDLCVGFLTIRLTYAIAKSQEKTENDKISSDKFFKISFIRDFQAISEDTEGQDLWLKIREYENNILSKIKVTNDVKITALKDGRADETIEPIVMRVRRKEYEMEHADSVAGKDGGEDSSGFCRVAFDIVEPVDLRKFELGRTYRFEFDIVATNIFGVEVKCRLSPWFEVASNDDGLVKFSAVRNLGYYDDVRYIGS